ncbi:MAG: RidA family protein [Puniceicoccaceae bacterium]|nr:MAG: RidA family protein [Puniceicoccaceae bacterium]
MSFEARLSELKIELPPAPAPAGNYLPHRRVGNLLFLAGAICLRDGRMSHTGQVGGERDLDYGREAARVCVLNALASIKGAVGSLDKVRQFVFVSGYVNAVSGFADSPLVINGASDFLVEVFGDAGRHARAAVAVTGLPKDSTVELQITVEVLPD